MREVSTEGLRLLNQGGEGAVYQYSPDKVLKIYFHKTEEDIALNIKQMAAFQEAGVPTVPMYEVVRCQDKLGLICEFVKGADLSALIAGNPERMEEYAAEFTGLIAKINRTVLAEELLPRKADSYMALLRTLEAKMPAEEFALVMNFMKAIPEARTCVQGDPHFRNFMFLQDRLVCVDLDSVGQGHPIFDVGRFYLYSMLMVRKTPRAVGLLGMDAECGEKMWNYFVRLYFPAKSEEEIAKAEKNIRAYAYLFWLAFLAVPGLGTEEKFAMVMIGARKDAFPYLPELMGADPFMD